MLSVGGLVAAVVIAAAAGLETWTSTGAPAAEQAVAVVDVPAGAVSLRQEREILNLKTTVDTLEIKVEQLRADNERLSRQLRDLKDQLGPATASIARRNPRSIAQEVAVDRKADRTSVHFPAEQPAKARRSAAAASRRSGPASTPLDDAPVRTTRTYFALQLPSFRTIADLTTAWNGIRRRSGKILVGLEPRAYAVRDAEEGVIYRLLAGPIRNAGDAAVRCVRLGEIGIPCETTVFAGERVSTAAIN